MAGCCRTTAEAKDVKLEGFDYKLTVCYLPSDVPDTLIQYITQLGHCFIRFGNNPGIGYTKPLAQLAVRFSRIGADTVNINGGLGGSFIYRYVLFIQCAQPVNIGVVPGIAGCTAARHAKIFTGAFCQNGLGFRIVQVVMTCGIGLQHVLRVNGIVAGTVEEHAYRQRDLPFLFLCRLSMLFRLRSDYRCHPGFCRRKLRYRTRGNQKIGSLRAPATDL
ncbi:hypothetical protein BW31_03016 [Pantoea agglomerans]|nr:hypothetical protein BW31_03016 [Pantoea agglomerans]